MDNEELNNNPNANPNPEDSSTDYIAAIKKMKETTVSRDEYERLVKEKKQLVDALVNGESVETQPKSKSDIGEMRKNLVTNGCKMTNLEYITNVCDLRDALLDAGEDDPFVPKGSKYVPTDEDYDTAEKVAQIYRECINYANGDPILFTNELMRRTVDAAPTATNARRGNRRN